MGSAFNTDRTPTCDEIVSALLSGHPLGQPVSTCRVLADFRNVAPARIETDDQVVESIVTVATGRTMSVVFDHRCPPEHQPPPSLAQPEALR